MNANDLAQAIKQSVTARQIAEHYGLEPNRAGFVRCPFHSGDHQASLKLYDGSGGFCCYGCKAQGSVIDFVMRLNGCKFMDACKAINDDFSLCLPIGSNLSYREKKRRSKEILTAKERWRERERTGEELDRRYWQAFDLWRVAELTATRYRPDKLDGKIIPGYANAVRELPLLAENLTQAEIERWNFEQSTRGT